jgi:hypothetical protein
MTVRVEGLRELADAPGWLDSMQRRFLGNAVDRLGDSVRSKAPGGPTGRAALDVEARTLSSTRGVVRSRGWIGAKTLERGAVMRPRKGKAMRFAVNGQTVFSRGASVVKGRGYYRKGLRPRAKIVREEWDKAKADVRRDA